MDPASSRIVDLAALAPEVVEAILCGEEPTGLSLGKLGVDLFLSSEEQRTSLGSPAVYPPVDGGRPKAPLT